MTTDAARHAWRSFFIDIPASENCILASFNPDTSRNELIVITESKRVRWYDVSGPKIHAAPCRAVEPPVPIPGTPSVKVAATTAPAKATVAVLFDPPAPRQRRAAPVACQSTETVPQPLQPVARAVKFDDPDEAVPPSATAAAARIPAHPVGAVGNAAGGIDIFTHTGFTMGFRLSSGAPVLRISIVDSLTLVDTTEGASNDFTMPPPTGSDLYSPARPHAAADAAGFGVASPVGRAGNTSINNNDVELRTDQGDSEPNFGRKSPHWTFTLAVLDESGTIALLQPQGPGAGDGVLRTLHRPLTSVARTRALAASAEGVLYHAGPRGSRRIVCLVGADATKESAQELRLPTPSVRAVRAMDAFRHMAFCSRGSDLYKVDFRAGTSEFVIDVKENIDLVRMCYPVVILGGENGGIYFYSVVAHTVLAATATYNGTAPRSLEYSWSRGILVVVDATGAVELLEAPAVVRAHCRGPLSTLATGRVLRRAVELEGVAPARRAKLAENLLLERVVVPDDVSLYMGKQVRLI